MLDIRKLKIWLTEAMDWLELKAQTVLLELDLLRYQSNHELTHAVFLAGHCMGESEVAG